MTLRGIDDSAARAFCRGLEGPPEVKTLATFSPNWTDSGQGRQPWPAMAQRDFQSIAGPLADHSTISIALAWKRRNITQGRLCVGTEEDGEYDEIDKHPMIVMLRRPNPWDSWRATLGGTSDCISVDGNAYWIKSRNGLGDVAEITWVPNHMIEVVPEMDPQFMRTKGPIRGYWYTNGPIRQWYAPSEIVHFRNGRDPFYRWMGMSDLKRQLRNAGGIMAAERYTMAILINAHSGKVVSPKTGGNYEPDEKEMQAVVDTVKRSNSEEGAGSIGKVLVPIDINDIGFGPEGMMLDRIIDRPESYILASLGLNAMTLNLPSSKDVSTYANKGEARREAVENGVIPDQDLIADEIEAQLLPDFADWVAPPDAEMDPEEATDPKPNRDPGKPHYCVWWDRKDVHALREDANDRASRAVSLRGASIATLNESRCLVDLPEIEGGDASPIEEAAQAHQQQLDQIQAHADATAGQDPNDPNDDPTDSGASQ